MEQEEKHDGTLPPCQIVRRFLTRYTSCKKLLPLGVVPSFKAEQYDAREVDTYMHGGMGPYTDEPHAPRCTDGPPLHLFSHPKMARASRTSWRQHARSLSSVVRGGGLGLTEKGRPPAWHGAGAPFTAQLGYHWMPIAKGKVKGGHGLYFEHKRKVSSSATDLPLRVAHKLATAVLGSPQGR